ncbi:MAG: hypothetical protein NVSMB70_01120 [Chamaesiphon sp.]
MDHDPEQELYDRAAFGKQIENFWSSPIGGYLRARANDCYTAGLVKLKSVDATNTADVMKAQNEVKVAEQFIDWLEEGVQEGLQALNLLEGNENDV